MPTKKKVTAVKTRYAVMIPRHQVFCFEVEAKSAEDACKTLWRKLRLDNDPVPPADAKAITSYWGDPKENTDGWLVTSDPKGEIIQGWNGKELVRAKLR